MKIDRLRIYLKYSGHCAYCGNQITLKSMQVDHVIPQRNYFFHVKNRYKIPSFLSHLTENDCNHIDNLFPACRVCNKWKDAHDLELFRFELGEQIKRLNERSSNYRIAKKYGLITENNILIIFYFEKQ